MARSPLYRADGGWFLTRAQQAASRTPAELAAEQMKKQMPVGHAHTCLDTKDLPRIFKEIFAHSILNEARL